MNAGQMKAARLHAVGDLRLDDEPVPEPGPGMSLVRGTAVGHVRLGATTAVVGCGPIGLLLIQVLRAAGAGPVAVFDPLPQRRAAAADLGAAAAVDPAGIRTPADVRQVTGEGVDVAFEMA